MELLKRKTAVVLLPTERIRPNPSQPRRDFDAAALSELAESIRNHGILQPLTVRRTAQGYELVAGERRLRAARMAGLREVPCLILRVEAEESSVLALVENLQRRDLHYLEEAEAIARLIATCGLSQEQAAQKLGCSQSAVANKLRLLRLSDACAALLRQNELTERHARALLRLSDEEERLDALRHIAAQGLNVAQSEAYIDALLARTQRETPTTRAPYLVKDVRLFLNSVKRGLGVMQRSGVDARTERADTDDEIRLLIRIPKRRGEKTAVGQEKVIKL